MITADMIPDEVVKAALSAYKYASSDVYTTEEHDMAEALVAALNSWPGIQGAWYEGDTPTAYILPLPQENPDD